MKKTFILIIFLSSTFVFSQKEKKTFIIPDYIKVQFAGNIGFLSTGVGYVLFDGLLYSDFIYGYVPKFTGNNEIHLLTKKNSFFVYTKKIKKIKISSILGFALTYETGKNSFVFLDDKYPKDYYKSNAFHFLFFGGISVHKRITGKSKITGFDFIAELGTVDVYLWYKVQSREIKLYDIFSLALGINIHI